MAMTDDDLIECYIVPDPNKSSKAEARVKDRWVSVWALIGYLQGGANGDPGVVADDYDISREAMEAALAYYRRHKCLIDARLEANSDDVPETIQDVLRVGENPGDPAEADLIARHLELHPGKPSPAEVIVKGRGVPVWALIGYLQGGANGDPGVVADDYDISREAMEAALAYYRRHKCLIDARLEANAA
jgi:uncharacterized protein (DUF433 family)